MIDWDSLTIDEQEQYLRQARYLVERGYIMGEDEDSLAKRIYESKKREGNT